MARLSACLVCESHLAHHSFSCTNPFFWLQVKLVLVDKLCMAWPGRKPSGKEAGELQRYLRDVAQFVEQAKSLRTGKAPVHTGQAGKLSWPEADQTVPHAAYVDNILQWRRGFKSGVQLSVYESGRRLIWKTRVAKLALRLFDLGDRISHYQSLLESAAVLAKPIVITLTQGGLLDAKVCHWFSDVVLQESAKHTPSKLFQWDYSAPCHA